MREQSLEQIYIVLLALWLLCVPHSQTMAQNTPRNESPNNQAAPKSVTPPAEPPAQAPAISTIEAPPPIPREKPEFRVWTADEIKEAQEVCSAVMAQWKIKAKPLPTIADHDKCGDPAPLLVSEIYTTWQDKMVPVRISPPATLNCKMAGKTAAWLSQTVQKAADEFFTQPVTKIFNVASYHCRKRYNALVGKMSEHAFANALDISSFQLQDGAKISLIKDWQKEPKEPVNTEKTTANPIKAPIKASVGTLPPIPVAGSAQEPIKEPAQSVFLKTIHKGACSEFSTVLGPESNAAHADHFHLDLGRNGRYQICE